MGVIGQDDDTTAEGAYGVLGASESSGQYSSGVYGYADALSGETFGVSGYSLSNVGVGAAGEAVTSSAEGRSYAGTLPIGAWGDTGVAGAASLAFGVLATADDNIALRVANNAPSNYQTAVFENEESSSAENTVLETYGGYFGGICSVDVSGDLGCSGTKSAVVPVDSGQRRVALYAVEAPQNWFEDFGGGQLISGSATVRLDPTFAQTVNTGSDYHVFLTPKGDSKGLYVTNETTTSFEVHEQQGGQSNIAFDYRIVALRKGYEEVRLADKTEQWKQMLAHTPKRRATPGTKFTPPRPRFPAPPGAKLASVARRQ